MAAGWSLETLAELPLDSWVEFYAAVRSRDMQKMAQLVTAMHSADPQRLRQMLMNESKRVGMGKDAEWWRDPQKVKEFAMGIPGVGVRAEGKK